MTSGGYFSLALLVLLLLPMAIVSLERGLVPWRAALLLAGGGIATTALHGGADAGIAAMINGLVASAALGLGLTALRRATGLALLTGSELRLVCAGTPWLAPPWAGLFILAALAGAIVIATVQSTIVRKLNRRGADLFITTILVAASAIQSSLTIQTLQLN